MYDHGSSKFCYAVLQGLKKNKSMKNLILGRIQFTEENLSCLGELLSNEDTKFELLSLANNSVEDPDCFFHLTEALKVNKTLKHLRIFAGALGPKTMAMLADAMTVNKTIQTLELIYCKAGKESCGSFVKIIAENQTLKSLKICTNGLSETDDCEALAIGIQQNYSLLNFEYSLERTFNDKDVSSIDESIRRNQSNSLAK